MADLFITYRGAVYPAQCDAMGHMNVMYYTGKFDEATWQMFAAIGITPVYVRSEQRGVAAIRQSLTYRRELFAGDLVSVYTGILEIQPRQIRFYHEMRADPAGELCATSVITGVFMDTQTRKPAQFPDDIIARARELIVDIHPVT